VSDSNFDSPPPAVDALVNSMMASCGQLSLILEHMHRHQAEGRSAPDARNPAFVLAELLSGVLAGLAAHHGEHDLATTAQMLESATRIIGEELFVVDVERLDHQAD
jgi:hypothetical protein